MILESLVIDKIRSYDHEEIVFPRGISLFEGDIGSGKSSVLMAIEFALFGLGSQKAESLLAKKAQDGYVILEFSVDGEKFEIKRALKRKEFSVGQDPKNSWIKIDGQKEPLSPSELKQRILQILKFNEPADPKAESRIFRYAIFTPQEAMKEVLGDSRKRLETIRRAFGIEDYSVAKINAKEVTDEFRLQMASLKEKFSNITLLESQISESKKILLQVNSDIEKSEKQKKEFESKEKSKNLELREMQAKNNEKVNLEATKKYIQEKIDTAKLQIERIEKDFSDSEIELKHNNEKLTKLLEVKKPTITKSVPEIITELRKFQRINDELIRFRSEKNNLIQDLSKIKDTIGEKMGSDATSLENTLRDLENEKKSLERFSLELDEKLEVVNAQKIQKQTLINSLEKEITELSQLGNTCPTCRQDISQKHHHDLVQSKNKERETISQELKSITDSFFDSKSKSKELVSKIESYNKEILQINKIHPVIVEHAAKSSKLMEIEAKILEFSRDFQIPGITGNPIEYLSETKDKLVQYENVSAQVKQIIEAKNRVEKLISKTQGEVQSIEADIEKNEIEMKQIQTKLKSFDSLAEDISKKESELNATRKEITQITSSLATLNERKETGEARISENQKQIAESRKWEQKFKAVSQYREWLESFFVPTIAQIEKQVLLSIWRNFNEAYRKWYSILIEDQSKESQIDENFTPIINQDGYEQEVGFLSGGEKTSIALAYRLTLNSLMRKETESMKSNLLILDEPTDGFSKNQLSKIREVLDELKSEQIILVSHEKELEAYVDNIFQISKQNGISRVSRLNN